MNETWREKYQTLLFNRNVSLNRVNNYVNKHVPRYLYKYRKFDQYWETTLFDGQLYFAEAITLNDPFDCHTFIDVKRYSEFMNTFASKYVFPEIEYDKICEVYNSRMENNLKRQCLKIKQVFLLTCFSEDVKSILMWSHYADSHKGFCIEYDMEKVSQLYRDFLYPVIYQDQCYDFTEMAIMLDASYYQAMKALEILNVNTEYCLKDVTNNIYVPLLIKAKEWSYEKEWRIVVHKTFFGLNDHLIDLSNAISGVYIGANSGLTNNIDKIIKWAKNKNIVIYRMETEMDRYGLLAKIIS